MNECWRPIAGFEGIYEASTTGKVRSVDRATKLANGNVRKYRGQLISQFENSAGYYVIRLSKNGKTSPHRVHRIVAETFIGERGQGLEIRHLDGNPKNNDVSNLKYGTHSENMFDKRGHGTDYNANKSVGNCGHTLVDERNLVKSRFASHGHRICLACTRARAYVQKFPNSDFEKVKAIKYAAIMA